MRNPVQRDSIRMKRVEETQMKKLMAVLLAAMMLLGVVSVASADQLSDIQAKGVLELGANIEFPPYEFYWTNPETGEEEIAGFDMDLARGIANELGVELKINDQAFSGLVTALSVGDLDMVISGLAIKPERLDYIMSLPHTAEFERNGVKIHLAHSNIWTQH